MFNWLLRLPNLLGVELKYATVIILILMLAYNSAPAQTGTPETSLKPCREQPSLVGKCFTVRGRLSLYNGAPTLRLWRAGTRRMLGVSGSYSQAGYSSIPEELEKRLDWETELWGD